MGRAVTQTLARAQIQLISTNFSNCSTKEKQDEEEEEELELGLARTLRAQWQIKRRNEK